MALHLASPPAAFAEALRGELGGRAWLARDPESGRYHASSPRLRALADLLSTDTRDVHGHEAVFLETGRGTGALFGAFLHSTRRGQAQGGVRHWAYPTLEAYLRDGLRLSLGMTRKNALARLWWGGGKGLILRPPGGLAEDPDFRRSLYREFGAFVSGLRGCYVTAEDVGTRPSDMAEIFRTTRFTTCVAPERGGSGDPGAMTAAGVVCAIEAALAHRGMGDLAGKAVAVQGAGSVGAALIRRLLERGVARIVASELCEPRRRALLQELGGAPVEIRAHASDDASILSEPCDVFAPCALGGVLGAETIPHLRAAIVCGSANNPLCDEERDSEALAARGITYVPDFVANRMGIVSCSNEQYGSLPGDPAVLRHLDADWEGGIHATTLRVLEDAKRRDVTPVGSAVRLADALARETHPIWGHRALHIHEALRANGWSNGG